MNAEKNKAIEDAVMSYLSGVNGCTAWMLSLRIGTSREEVSKACRRLKHKGLVAAAGSYFQVVKL